MLKLFHFLNIFQSKFRKKPPHYQTVRNSSILFFIFVSFNNLSALSDTESTLWKNDSLIFFCLKVLLRQLFGQKCTSKWRLSFPCDIIQILRTNTKTTYAQKKMLICLLNLFLGAYYDKMTQPGITLSDQMLLGSVVATNLVVVVTAQVT